jgi:Tfp pilus assembly protein PilX
MTTRTNNIHLPHVPRRRPQADKGFALVVTLSLMVLLTIIAVGLLALSSISLRSANAQSAQAVAQANARMALMLAIGELQKATGPDQRVTMTSGLQVGDDPANPNWAGATDVSPAALATDPKSAKITWLVSGGNPDPTKVLTRSTQLNQGNALKLGSYLNPTAAAADLLAPVVNVTQGNTQGRYAWWIGDEGTKARVDVAKPEDDPGTNFDRLTRSQSALEGGFAKLGEDWSEFAPSPAGSIDKTTLISIPTASLAAETKTLAAEYFNDITTGGYGLPVNVTTGGMKADLSLIFDRSQFGKKFGEIYCGATPARRTWNGADILTFATKSAPKFYLSEAVSSSGNIPTGPNWGILWNYATLWQGVGGGQMPLVSGFPMVESDLRFKNWLPYTNHNQGAWRRDVQQTNSPVTPVLSFFQMGFRLNSERLPPTNPPSATPMFKAQVGIQPVLGLWNPYNVTIRAAPYRFDWALYPYLRFNYARPTGTGGFTDGRLTKLWLREEWTAGGKVIPTPDAGGEGKWLQLETPSVDLQPGEFRIFSVVDRINIRAGQVYSLKPGWSEKGAFIVDLKDDAGNTRLVPSGYRAWFGDIVLQDTQSNDVKSKFPTLDLKTVSSTWFTLKSGSNTLMRSTEIWNGGNDPAVSSGFKVPEPVVSGHTGGLNTTKPTYLIDDLAGDRVTPNIATWSFFLRTTNQMEGPDDDQRLRGWIDSNPRALVSNSLWDGSRMESSGERTGWHTTSHWMGAWNAPGKPRVVGDGRGGNRGLLSEGGSAPSEPEVSKSGGRYQGFGGASNTLAGGRTHVIVYDVPRSPLVSIGQFQHAQLARYNFEPGFVVGNSYANPRIPLGATSKPDFNGISGFNLSDISYEVNRKLWDGFFFSTLAPDYVGGSGSSFDKLFDAKKLADGTIHLPNPRMVFAPLPGDSTIDRILADNGDRAPEAITARILVKGAFNVNSTSKAAWKAMLSSMGASQLPVIDPQRSAVSWKNPEGVRFNRFGHVLTDSPYQKGGGGDDDPFWQGWRNLSDDELDRLATEIVKEVKERGPFRSMAEFVNRNPGAEKAEHQLKGPIQAALDRAISASLPTSVGRPAVKPPGAQFSNAVTDENTAVGSASYLMQGDVLQSLAPVLQVRSDYFRIRTCGEALDASGKVIARAWCEAVVQRTSEYLDSQDLAYKNATELVATANKTFGRRYQIVSFRWLNNSEI